MATSSRKPSLKTIAKILKIVNMYACELVLLSSILILVLSVPLIFIKSIWFDRPVVVQKVVYIDGLRGKVTGKSMVGNLYTIDCGEYGKFLVTEEQYDNVRVGDDIPSYLKGRGQ